MFFSNITLAVLAKTGGNVGDFRFLGPGTTSSSEPQKKMEHLSCFAPAMLALYYSSSPAATWALEEAEAIMKTCMSMYRSTKTGLAAEAYEIKGPPARLIPLARQRYSLLRPEAIESAFVLWRVTRKQEYREFGWAVFLSLERHSRRRGRGAGYAAVEDVMVDEHASDKNHLNRVDSFFLRRDP